jgi:hypothetical protein
MQLLAGPTSFAPIVEAAVDIVERSGGQYHVLVIVADGQVLASASASALHCQRMIEDPWMDTEICL